VYCITCFDSHGAIHSFYLQFKSIRLEYTGIEIIYRIFIEYKDATLLIFILIWNSLLILSTLIKIVWEGGQHSLEI